jgi:hypothetical protein
MSYLGELPLGSIAETILTTAVNGVPTDLAGSPAISVYKQASTTESTTGVTLTTSYDSRTGMARVSIDTSSDSTFYAADNFFDVIITTGTLGGVSMVGYEICSFRLTHARTTLDKTINSVARGTVTTGASTTSIPTSTFTMKDAAASGVVASQFVGRVVVFDGDTTTAGLRDAASTISASTASNTPTLTVATLPATPASGDTFSII